MKRANKMTRDKTAAARQRAYRERKRAFVTAVTAYGRSERSRDS